MLMLVLYCTVLYCTYSCLLSGSSTYASLYMLPTRVHWSLCVLAYMLIDLYCTVLYCTVLCCTVLYSTLLYCTVLYCTVLCCTVLYCTMLYSTYTALLSSSTTCASLYMLPTRVHWTLCVLTCMLIDPYCTVLYRTVLDVYVSVQ